MIKSYKLQQHANTNKLDKLKEILQTYRILSQKLSSEQWKNFFQYESPFDKNADITTNSILSERYKRNCLYQTVSILNSYLSNLQNSFKEIVYNSSLKEEQKKILFYINKYKLYYSKTPQIKKINIDQELLGLSRKVMRHLFKINKKPCFKHVNMLLNENVAQLSKRNKFSHFEYWLKLSTLIKGKTIDIPISSNNYFNKAKGKINSCYQFNLKDNKFDVVLTKTEETNYKPSDMKIGIDVGLRTLIATSCGDLFGQDIIDYLKKYYLILQDIYKERNKLRVCSSTKRSKKLVKKIRGHLKQLVFQIFNKIVERYSPAEIVVEKLDFRSPDLSKKMNRIMSNFGKSIITKALDRLQEIGIKITYVNPAYTSQECSVCHYVDKKNRSTRNNFKCKMCENKLNADINGARSILMRSSNKLYSTIRSRKDILDKLVKGFIERSYALYSEAREVITNSSYCKEYELYMSKG